MKNDEKWYEPGGRYYHPYWVRPSHLIPSKDDWEKIENHFRRCPITARTGHDKVLDHDHNSFFIRGYVSKPANKMLGYLDAWWEEENNRHATESRLLRKAIESVEEYISFAGRDYDVTRERDNKEGIAKALLKYKRKNLQHAGIRIVYPQWRKRLVDAFAKISEKAQRTILSRVYGLPFALEGDRVKAFRMLFYKR